MPLGSAAAVLLHASNKALRETTTSSLLTRQCCYLMLGLFSTSIVREDEKRRYSNDVVSMRFTPTSTRVVNSPRNGRPCHKQQESGGCNFRLTQCSRREKGIIEWHQSKRSILLSQGFRICSRRNYRRKVTTVENRGQCWRPIPIYRESL